MTSQKSSSENSEDPTWIWSDKDIEDGRREVLKWNSIASYSDIPKDHLPLLLFYLSNALGYIPKQAVYIPAMSNIYQVVNQFYDGEISEAKKDSFLRSIAKKVRCREMHLQDLYHTDPMTEDNRHTYENTASAFRHVARDRFCQFLGFEPDVEYSWKAEVNLRNMFLDDTMDRKKWGHLDWHGISLYEFRKIAMQEGLEAALKSELIGVRSCIERGLNPFVPELHF